MNWLRWTSLMLITAFGLFALSGAGQGTKAVSSSFTVTEATIDDIHAAFKSGKLTARQLVQAYLDRIDAYDKKGPNINSVITLNPNAMAEAQKLDDQFKKSGLTGPLHGIPVLVKDEIDTAGMPTTLGSIVFKDYRPPLDAFVVAKLRKAGAIILGKTTLAEFAAGDTYGSMFGVTRNPYDVLRTVGGSSGGSAAAVAANLSAVALGEETLASIRRPATWTSIVSMRPTSGLVSRTGMYDGYPTEPSTPGPMARTVKDLAQLFDAMIGYDPEDPQTALGVGQGPQKSYVDALDKNALKSARIGILRETIGLGSEPDSDDFKRVAAVFDKNVAELKAAGAVVIDPIVIPGLKELSARRGTNSTQTEDALKLWLARNPTSPFKTRADVGKSPDIDKVFPPNKANQWKNTPGPTNAANWGEYLTSRQQLMINLMKVFADNRLDAIVHRSMEQEPALLVEGPRLPNANRGVPVLNVFLVYVPSLTVPAGFTSTGLPTGITFLGKPYSESSMLRLGYAYEQSTHHRVPPKTAPPLPPQ